VTRDAVNGIAWPRPALPAAVWLGGAGGGEDAGVVMVQWVLGHRLDPLGAHEDVLGGQQSVLGAYERSWGVDGTSGGVAVDEVSVSRWAAGTGRDCRPLDPVGEQSHGRSTRVMTDGGRVDGRVDDDPSTEPVADADDRGGVAVAYRHDVHKLRARPHASAAESYAGVAVNETVPCGADRDAALLSRPRGEPEQTVANHRSPYRLSLLTGETAVETNRIQAAAGGGFRKLVTAVDPERLHARWLTTAVAGAYNESVYYPYTSLQYHVLLTAALLHNYRAGYAFEDLWLVATGPDLDNTLNRDTATTRDSEAALAADEVEPHRTVCWTPDLALHLTASPGDRPAARLGSQPARSFADVWSRLPAHPIGTDGGRCWRLLDAQLRRIRSWSTSLAFIDEFTELHGSAAERGGWA
jgi:hypothetical protein